MNAHDLVSFILTAVVVIGVVASIGSSAQKARDKRRQTFGGAVMPGAPPARPGVAPVPQRVARAYVQRAAPPPAMPTPTASPAPPAMAPIVASAMPPIGPPPATGQEHEPGPRPSLRTGALR
ncbi:MAG: hypothetical protein ACYDGM_04100, partial [Vulcanimicrobiaceae bacterium]